MSEKIEAGSERPKRFLSQTEDKFMLRLPGDMRSTLKYAAKSANRSLNAEIVYRLTTWRSPESATGGASMVVDVDSSQVEMAVRLLEQLETAALSAQDACQKLGLKIGGSE